ncbi:MAG: hypothetical protein R3346_03935 [Candidatus Spechtbacterales bacterium]|nr:hypothetical protein [Candidatus Spechtbacterales bacterium]
MFFSPQPKHEAQKVLRGLLVEYGPGPYSTSLEYTVVITPQALQLISKDQKRSFNTETPFCEKIMN